MTTKEHFAPETFNESNPDVAENALTPHELAFLAGTTAEIIEQLVEMDLINPREHSKTLLFDIETVQTVRKILRLRRHLQISFDSMALIFDLLGRIDALEEQVSELEKE